MKHSLNAQSYHGNDFINFCVNIYKSKIFLPVVLFVWFIIFIYAKYDSNNYLRGSHKSNNKIENMDNITLFPSKKFDINVNNNSEEGEEKPTNLIIVAGHAVLRLSNLKNADKQDDGWYLLSYQRNQGFPYIISSHIKKGVILAKNDPSSLLIFSGGQTRKDVGPTSEAASYYYLAQEKNWLSQTSSNLINRVYLEEYARDSYENLLFSICRFYEIVNEYPKNIIVVGFDFKNKRFTDFHRKAIGFPSQNFTYYGIKSTSVSPNFNQNNAIKGENIAIKSFSNDLYGCNDPSLYSKKKLRNPFRRTVPYQNACPDLKELIKWCGPSLFPVEKLPWGFTNNI
jgi:hypothetical protein